VGNYKWWGAVFIAVILLIVAILIYDRSYYEKELANIPHSVQQFTSYIKADHYVHALVVDMDTNANPSLLDLYNGNDALLAIHKNPDPLRHDDDVIGDMGVMLALFDQNHDGRIDGSDAVFNQLELVFFNKPNGNWQYVPVSQAGIRVIYVDPKYYNKVGLQLPINKLAYPVGTVIMADSTARLMRDVLLDDDYLKKQLNK
jgi:hypothetical protein